MPKPRVAPSRPPGRLDLVDLARGLAIVQMVAYHFIYDLNYFGWIKLVLTASPGFIAWRSAIVAQFLLLVGIGIGLGHAEGRPELRFWKRWIQIAAAAALVSAASATLFGPRFIWFGILHFVALALLLARALPKRGASDAAVDFLVGAAALAAGLLVQDERFDGPVLSWLGMVAHKPATEDYVPLLPWIGVVAIGLGISALWRRRSYSLPSALESMPQPSARALIGLGRWPLTVYLLHQPLLMGILALARAAS